MIKNIILIEYLSAKRKKNELYDLSILSEGINMIEKLALDLAKNNTSKNILVLRNKILNSKLNKKINYIFSSEKNNWLKVLKKYDTQSTAIILIAPEIKNKLSVTSKKILDLGFKLLNSSEKSLKIFSSKLLTFKYLKKNQIPCLKTYSHTSKIPKLNKSFVIKPNYGAGSKVFW